jgi:hypothetical protein
LAKEAAETVVLVIDEEGVESLISELLKAVGDSQVVFVKRMFLCCTLSLSLSHAVFMTSMVSGFNPKKFFLFDRIFLQKQQTVFG